VPLPILYLTLFANKNRVFKPQLSFLGDGVHLLEVKEEDVSNRDGLAKWAHKTFPDGKWTVQEYIRDPLTYQKRKFDLRVWAVVTSIDPLRIYILDHAMPKVSTMEYSSDVSQMKQMCMHIKMPLGPSCQINKLVPSKRASCSNTRRSNHTAYSKRTLCDRQSSRREATQYLCRSEACCFRS